MSLQKALKKIDQLIQKDIKRGYGGICIETEEYDELKIFPVEILPILKEKYRSVYYHGHKDWLRPNCELYHNAQRAYVGNMLSIDF